MSVPKFTVAQEVHQVRERHWRWSVWLEGSASGLDEVRFVEYFLHPTFKDPVRKVTDRAVNFRLNSSGWGQFTITARVVLKNGGETIIEHALRFSDHEQSSKGSVFISYGSADVDEARRLVTLLRTEGIQVVDAFDDIAPGVPFSSYLMSSLESCSVVVAILRRSSAPNVVLDVEYARQRDKAVVWLLEPGDADNLSQTIEKGRAFYDQEAIVGEIVRLLTMERR